jgi:hypothetical protein
MIDEVPLVQDKKIYEELIHSEDIQASKIFKSNISIICLFFKLEIPIIK